MELARDTLRDEPVNTHRANGIHEVINRIDANLHNIFRQLDECLLNMPISFQSEQDEEFIKSILDEIFENGVVSEEIISNVDTVGLKGKSYMINYNSKLVFNFNNTKIKYKFGKIFLEYVVDKLEKLDDIMSRLSLRSKLGDKSQDELARQLLTRYRTVIREYSTQIEVSLLIRTRFSSEKKNGFVEDSLKTIKTS
jgi:hypothetical protein